MLDRIHGTNNEEELTLLTNDTAALNLNTSYSTRALSRSQEQKRHELRLGKIITHVELTNSANLSSRSLTPSTPSPDADPDCANVIKRNAQPFSDHESIKHYLIKMNAKFPVQPSRQEFLQVRAQQAQKFIKFIRKLNPYDLKYLSLYMHSVQIGNSKDIYFQHLRKECGFFGFFQPYGNTKTWQRVRSAVKDALDNHLVRSEVPGKKPMAEKSFAGYLQIFQQHSGRKKFFDSPCLKTRSEARFIRDFEPNNLLPSAQITVPSLKRKIT